MQTTNRPSLFQNAKSSPTRIGGASFTTGFHVEREQEMDLEKIAQGVQLILEGIGEDPNREGLLQTPSRVARLYKELCYGINKDAADEITCLFSENTDEIVLVRDIQFASLCEHHLLPFMGVAHVAYVPKDGTITGLSKLARVVELASRRPQLQERMTTEIADALQSRLEPAAVAVVIEAEHLCMTIRGIRKPGSTTVTSAVRGSFATDQAARAEVMSLIRQK